MTGRMLDNKTVKLQRAIGVTTAPLCVSSQWPMYLLALNLTNTSCEKVDTLFNYHEVTLLHYGKASALEPSTAFQMIVAQETLARRMN